ncbi:MAG: DUF1570 domain-containing protein [Candidatus Omnitrophota bacterium]
MNAQDELERIVTQRGGLLRRNSAQVTKKPRALVLSPSTSSNPLRINSVEGLARGALLCFFMLGAVFPGFASECGEISAQKLSQPVFLRMRELFGGTVSSPKVILYPTDEALRNDIGLSSATRVAGRYDPDSDELRVACREENTIVFERVLRHEAAHYYIYRVFGTIPPLLEEGIAAYMETGILGEGAAEEHLNSERLKEFRALLRRGRVPGLDTFFLSTHNKQLSSADYAAAWAFVFAMLHNPDPRVQSERRKILRSMLAAGGSPGTNPYRLFVNAITASEGNFKKWEVNWRRGIWSLEMKK